MDVMTVRDLTLDPPTRLPAESTIRQAAGCMEDGDVSCVFVGPRMAVVTEHDLAGALASGLDAGAPLDQIATRTPLWLTTSNTVTEAVSLMVGHDVRHLVVISSRGVVLGTLSLSVATAALLDRPEPPATNGHPTAHPVASTAGRAPDLLRTIAVGFDGSPGSASALRWACFLAQQAAARVVVVHAIGLLEYPDSGQVAAEFEAEARSIAAKAGVDIDQLEFLAMLGNPDSVLRHAMDPPTSADLLVLGTRGHESHRGATIGSTGHHMIEEGLLPVVIVPADTV